MIVYVLFLFIIFALMIIDKFLLIKRKQVEENETSYQNNKECLSVRRKDGNKLSYPLMLVVIILYLFSALRFDIGWDYMAYYETIVSGLKSNIISLGEYATIILINIAKKSVTNIYFAANSFICIFFIIKTIKNYSKDRWLSILFFVCFPLFYLNSFSTIRMFSALALTFYGFKYIESKNFIKYSIIVILASSFHKSAAVAIILYFVAHYIKVKTLTLFVALISLPMISSLSQLFILRYLPRYSVYFNPTNVQEGTKAIFIFILIGIIALVLRKKIIKEDYKASLYYNMYFVGLAIYIAFIKQGTLGHRLSLYGTIYSILLVPKIVSLFRNPFERTAINSIIYILCIIMFLLTILIGTDTYIPYKTVFI